MKNKFTSINYVKRENTAKSKTVLLTLKQTSNRFTEDLSLKFTPLKKLIT